jgi:hypothetical protein
LTELPEHVQAVIDAARVVAAQDDATSVLLDALENYRNAERPQPFERYMGRYQNTFGLVAALDPDHWDSEDPEIWRCTVTPIERVQ